jgi:hypothetical protein
MEKSVLRNKTIGAKVSDEEYASLEDLAQKRGLTVGEWCREVLLAELLAHPAEQTILAEILALRTILLNVVYALGQGETLSPEKMQQLIERADGEKGEKAIDRLAQRGPIPPSI